MSERQPPRAGYLVHVLPAALYVFAIFYGGLIPAPHVPGPQFNAQDKLLHAIAFGLMAVVVFRAARFVWPKLPLRRQLGIGFGLTFALGGLLELLQLLTSYRSAEWLDWVADGVGAFSAMALVDYRSASRRGADRSQ